MTKLDVAHEIRDTLAIQSPYRLEVWKNGRKWETDWAVNFDSNESAPAGRLYVYSANDPDATIESGMAILNDAISAGDFNEN